MQPKHSLYLCIVGVFVADPVGVLGGDFKPQPVGQEGVEQAARVEAVTSFYHVGRVLVLQVHPFEHFLGREIVVLDVEVGEVSSVVDDLLVNLREALSCSGGGFSDGGVGVEPARAGTDVEAVEEIVHLVVSNFQRMSAACEVLEEQVSVSQSKNNKVTALWQSGVKVGEQFDDIGLELLRRYDLPPSADIVTYQLEEHQHGVVVLLASRQGLDVALSVVGVASVDSQVLVVVVVAEIPPAQVLVEGVGRVGSCGVSSVG